MSTSIPASPVDASKKVDFIEEELKTDEPNGSVVQEPLAAPDSLYADPGDEDAEDLSDEIDYPVNEEVDDADAYDGIEKEEEEPVTYPSAMPLSTERRFKIGEWREAGAELQEIFGGAGGASQSRLDKGTVEEQEQELGDTEEEVIQGYLSLAADLRKTKDIKGTVGCYAEVMDLLSVRIGEFDDDENHEDKQTEITKILDEIYQFCDEVSAPAISLVYVPHQLQPQLLEEIRKLTSSVFQACKMLDHSTTTDAEHLLMALLYATGRWSEVVDIGRKLAIAESTGAASARDLRSRYLLAQVLRELDEPEKDEACALFEAILQSQKELLGPTDEKTLRATIDLATVQESLGRSPNALELLETTSKSFTEALGEADPKTLLCLSVHAVILAKAGSMDAAKNIIQKVEDGLDEVTSRKNAIVINTMANLARALVLVEDVEEAEAAYEELMPLQMSALGVRHPSALSTREDHARLLQSLGDFPGALAVVEDVAANRTRDLGRFHPLTLRVLFESASCLGACGKFPEAKTLLEEIAEGYAITLGRTSGKYIETLQGLGVVLVQMGHLVSARKVHEQVLAILTEKYGDKHEKTINALVKLAGVIWSSGMETEGLAMEVKALELQRSVLGPKHPTTLQTMHNHAVTLQSIGRYSKSLTLSKEVYESRKEVLGELNIHTIASLYTVAVSLEGLGEIQEAVKTGEQVVELAERSLAAGEMEEADIEEYRDSLVGMKKEVELFEKKFGALGGT
ncbi:hypothetical protein M408DRAFT_11104 [Serendipita vermifera MAFF 305830]|uniref:MalT-like TPR region domain-containing protein n=1 Tax=Serendipita vermifera MAFF 305830 TaxID=933852 RepID=A0A0C2WCN6_SERVB|nr:hypothetical protein M408DRAFT_11104 [Serendipita vermifera MAFF 305830]